LIRLFLLLLMGVSFLQYGCARAATDSGTTLFLEVTLAFREPVDLNRFRYFLVVSPTQGPSLPSPITGDYFPVPGHTYDEANLFLQSKSDGLSSYYTSFFSTWSDFFEIKNGIGSVPQMMLYSSGTTGFLVTSSNISYQPSFGFSPRTLTISGNQVFMLISLSYLPVLTNRIFFNVASSELGDGTESGEIRDVIDQTPISLSLRSGERIDTRTDDVNFGISGASDLVSWMAVIR